MSTGNTGRQSAKPPKSPTNAGKVATATGATSTNGDALPKAATNPPYEIAILGPIGQTGAAAAAALGFPTSSKNTVRYAIIPQSAGKPSSTATNDPVAALKQAAAALNYIATGGGKIIPQVGDEAALRKKFGKKVYPEVPDPYDRDRPPSVGEQLNEDLNTFDKRLVFAIDDKTGSVVYAMSAQNEHALVDGMVFTTNTDSPETAEKAVASEMPDDKVDAIATSFYGVPALMNPNSYINLQAAGGKTNNKYLIDRPNQIRWYNQSEPGYGDGSGVQGSTVPTVAEIVQWSNVEANRFKFPYRYIDFAHCKWWQKIPNNYLITLRRYAFPVNDSVTSSEEAKGELKYEKLKPVSTMLTWLGEDTGNKMSTIVGPIETGLKWKDIKSDVWEVSSSTTGGDVNNPAPGLAKILGFLTSGGQGTKTGTPGPTPPDPYNNGPYANKIIGPVNVIDSTKARERGLVFKHSISLVFEYTPRSIGGINTKAAALDLLGNALLMTSATAPFWGGANRHLPSAGHGTADPFLGGAAGKAAWMRGDPEGFFNALKDQFTKIFENVSDLFNKVMQDPVQGLQEIAKQGVAEFMKMSTTAARTQVQGMHSLLTGTPVGEWWLCVGNPLNPIMMMGNMICTGAKIEFSDELGPDDFPTELKITVTLEHGMPRDKAGIESMFNKGRGRIYALPKGYEKSFASSGQSPIDTSIGSRTTYMRNKPTEDRKKEADGNLSLAYERKYSPESTTKQPIVGNVYGALYGQGYSMNPKPADEPKDAKKTDQAAPAPGAANNGNKNAQNLSKKK